MRCDVKNIKDEYKKYIINKINEKDGKIAKLTKELEEEKLRPPYKGGSLYEECLNEFNELNK